MKNKLIRCCSHVSGEICNVRVVMYKKRILNLFCVTKFQASVVLKEDEISKKKSLWMHRFEGNYYFFVSKCYTNMKI